MRNTYEEEDRLVYSDDYVEGSEEEGSNDGGSAEVEAAPVTLVQHLAFFLMGMGSWMPVNAIWSQLPYYLHGTPEKYNIASRLALAIQLSNMSVALFLYLKGRKEKEDAAKQVVDEHTHQVVLPFTKEIGSVYVAGILVFVFLMLFDTEDVSVDGARWSLSLIILSFFAGLVGCMTTVVFWAFVAAFPHELLSTLSAGVGFSGIPSPVLSVIQNPGKHPRFPRQLFYGIHTLIIGLSLLAFLYILKRVYHTHHNWMLYNFNKEKEKEMLSTEGLCDESALSSSSHRAESVLVTNTVPNEDNGEDVMKVSLLSDSVVAPEKDRVDDSDAYIYMAILGWSSVLNYFQATVVTYMAKGFSNESAVVLWIGFAGSITSTIGRMITMATHIQYSMTQCVVLSILQTIAFVLIGIFGYPLRVSAPALVVVCSLFRLFFGYNSTMMFKVAAAGHDKKARHRSTLFGFAELSGSFCGTLIGFFVSNFYFYHMS